MNIPICDPSFGIIGESISQYQPNSEFFKGKNILRGSIWSSEAWQKVGLQDDDSGVLITFCQVSGNHILFPKKGQLFNSPAVWQFGSLVLSPLIFHPVVQSLIHDLVKSLHFWPHHCTEWLYFHSIFNNCLSLWTLDLRCCSSPQIC